MFEVLISFLLSFRVYFRTRSDNQLEILALRHQIVVLQRKTPKPKLKPTDRRLWVWLLSHPNILAILAARRVQTQRNWRKSRPD